MMLNERLDVRTRERWTQMHTNTAQVLNQILRDRQFKEWENRLRELESMGHIPRGTVRQVEHSENQKDASSGSTDEGPVGKDVI